MIRTAIHQLEPPARMPTYISSIEDESGSRASPAAVVLFFCLRTEVHNEDDRRPWARNSYQVIVISCLESASLLPPMSGVNFCPLTWNKSSMSIWALMKKKWGTRPVSANFWRAMAVPCRQRESLLGSRGEGTRVASPSHATWQSMHCIRLLIGSPMQVGMTHLTTWYRLNPETCWRVHILVGSRRPYHSVSEQHSSPCRATTGGRPPPWSRGGSVPQGWSRPSYAFHRMESPSCLVWRQKSQNEYVENISVYRM